MYNLLGVPVATLVDAVQQPGSYTLQFDAHHLPSGRYMYRLKAGEYTQIRKMVLLK